MKCSIGFFWFIKLLCSKKDNNKLKWSSKALKIYSWICKISSNCSNKLLFAYLIKLSPPTFPCNNFDIFFSFSKSNLFTSFIYLLYLISNLFLVSSKYCIAALFTSDILSVIILYKFKLSIKFSFTASSFSLIEIFLNIWELGRIVVLLLIWLFLLLFFSCI